MYNSSILQHKAPWDGSICTPSTHMNIFTIRIGANIVFKMIEDSWQVGIYIFWFKIRQRVDSF